MKVVLMWINTHNGQRDLIPSLPPSYLTPLFGIFLFSNFAHSSANYELGTSKKTTDTVPKFTLLNRDSNQGREETYLTEISSV